MLNKDVACAADQQLNSDTLDAYLATYAGKEGAYLGLKCSDVVRRRAHQRGAKHGTQILRQHFVLV